MTDLKTECETSGGKLIFRRYRFDPHTKKLMDARKYGKKAWPMCIIEPITNKNIYVWTSRVFKFNIVCDIINSIWL